jgi:hypothetical protein
VVDEARIRMRQHVLSPTEPPAEGPVARALWGFAQPLLGLRLVVRDSDLRTASVVPVLGLLLICVGAALLAEEGTAWERVGVAYATLLALAPIPSVLFGRHYARLAARVHTTLGLGPADPYYKPISRYLWESVLQVLAIGMGVAPVVAIVESLPLMGRAWGLVLGGLWALHWVVVEALDSARVLSPSETVESVEAAAHDLPEPWFVRIYRWPASVPGIIRGPVGLFGDMVDRIAREWRAEIQITERDTAVCLGFGASAAILLGIPGLNLLFRPAVVVGGTHLRGRLR